MSDQNTANNIQVGNGYGVMDRIINVNGIVDNSVTTESIVDNAITSSKIVDNTIVINDLALEAQPTICLLYTSPSPRDRTRSRMQSSA